MKRLKISKTGWWLLTGGIFLVVVVSLGLTYSQQAGALSQLEEELEVAEMRLGNLDVSQLRERQSDLQGQIDEAGAQLAGVKDGLRRTMESVDVIDEFYVVARSCGITVLSINTSPVGGRNLNGVDCRMISVSAAVTGSAAGLAGFIARLNGDFATGVVKTAQMGVAESLSAAGSAASISMVVYAYEGS